MVNRVSPWFLVLLVVTVVGGVLAALGTAELVEAGSSVVFTTGVVLTVLGGWAVSLCLHEFGHAFVAYRGGDLSVRDKGYLTLDIRRYTDIGLSFVLPVIFLLLGGIPLPGGAVWINHGALRSRAVRSLVSFAGPGTNLVLAAGLTLAVGVVPMPVGLALALSALALIQVLAFVLNLLPIPGLDGFGVIEPFLPPAAQRFGARVRPWAPIALLLLLFVVPQLADGVRPTFPWLAAVLDLGAVAFSALFRLMLAVFDLLGGDGMLAAYGYQELFFWRR